MSSQIYEVESILDYRFRKGVLEYRVKWKDYGEDESTWEPEENLTDCKEVIENFKKEVGLQQKEDNEPQEKIIPQRIRKRREEEYKKEPSQQSQPEDGIAFIRPKEQKKTITIRKQQQQAFSKKTPRKDPPKRQIAFEEYDDCQLGKKDFDQCEPETDFVQPQQEFFQESPLIITDMLCDPQKNIYFQAKRGKEALTISREEVLNSGDVKALLVFYERHVHLGKMPSKR